MDVMLLVEIDVNDRARSAMIGLPRNLMNTPFPPGPARDAVACGCSPSLLNELYVEATCRHPDRWPGTRRGRRASARCGRSCSRAHGPADRRGAVVDLWGVIRVVDAMGGIDIDVPTAVIDDPNYPDPVYGRIHAAHPRRHAALRRPARPRLRPQPPPGPRLRADGAPADPAARDPRAARRRHDPQRARRCSPRPRASPGRTCRARACPNLVELFGKAQTATVKQLRIVPPNYPEWLTKSEITKIRNAIAALLGVPPPPPPASPRRTRPRRPRRRPRLPGPPRRRRRPPPAVAVGRRRPDFLEPLEDQRRRGNERGPDEAKYHSWPRRQSASVRSPSPSSQANASSTSAYGRM